jgi:hypothetical protein
MFGGPPAEALAEPLEPTSGEGFLNCRKQDPLLKADVIVEQLCHPSRGRSLRFPFRLNQPVHCPAKLSMLG